jgi:hypothetical protein
MTSSVALAGGAWEFSEFGGSALGTVGAGNTNFSRSHTLGSMPAAGKLVMVVAYQRGAAAVPAVTMSAGPTGFTLMQSVTGASNHGGLGVWFWIADGTNTPTFNYAASGTNGVNNNNTWEWAIGVFGGANTTSTSTVPDKKGSTTSAGGAIPPWGCTTVVSTVNTFTWNTSITTLSTTYGCTMFNVVTNAPYTGTWTQPSGWDALPIVGGANGTTGGAGMYIATLDFAANTATGTTTAETFGVASTLGRSLQFGIAKSAPAGTAPVTPTAIHPVVGIDTLTGASVNNTVAMSPIQATAHINTPLVNTTHFPTGAVTLGLNATGLLTDSGGGGTPIWAGLSNLGGVTATGQATVTRSINGSATLGRVVATGVLTDSGGTVQPPPTGGGSYQVGRAGLRM